LLQPRAVAVVGKGVGDCAGRGRNEPVGGVVGVGVDAIIGIGDVPQPVERVVGTADGCDDLC